MVQQRPGTATASEIGRDDGCGPAECPPARRRDREATKRALLGAAVRVFACRGYDAATTREVAAAAGSNEQLIQRYFGGKAGLLLAVLNECAGAERREACALPPMERDLAGEIECFLAHHLEHAWENRDFLRVVLYRSAVDPEVAAEMGRHFAEARAPLILERLRAFQRDGVIPAKVDLRPVAAALSTLSFGLGVMDQVIFGADRAGVRATAAAIAKVIAAGLGVAPSYPTESSPHPDPPPVQGREA